MVVWGSRHGDECRVSQEVERCLKVISKGLRGAGSKTQVWRIRHPTGPPPDAFTPCQPTWGHNHPLETSPHGRG
jgi:hypothetical protein